MNGNGMSDSDPVGLFRHVAELLTGFGLAYLHVALLFARVGSTTDLASRHSAYSSGVWRTVNCQRRL